MALSAAAASNRASNPFASLDAEQTLVSPASRKWLEPARGSDAETKTYEVPAELLALARASSKERAQRRTSASTPHVPNVAAVAASLAEDRSRAESLGFARAWRTLVLAKLTVAMVAVWRALTIQRRQLGVIGARLSPVLRQWAQRVSSLAASIRVRVPDWRSSLRAGFRRPGR